MRHDYDRDLSARLLEGDGRAFIEVYDHYWYKLYLSSYRRIKNKAVAEELVQSLFMKLWEKRGSLQIDDLEKYLFSSIRNATIDFLNRQMVAHNYLEYQKVFFSMEGNTTEEMVEFNELEGALEKGLRALSGKSEKIFRLYRIDNWPVEKIAQHFNLSEKAVHYHLTRSQKFIRTFLQGFTLAFVVSFGLF